MKTPDPIFAMVEAWREATNSREEGGRLKWILDNLLYLERVKFQPFVPTLYSRHPISFVERFHAWLTNAGLSSDQQRDLFEFAYHIAFFSFDDFTSLFQNAFSGPITRWCIGECACWQAKLGTTQSITLSRKPMQWIILWDVRKFTHIG